MQKRQVQRTRVLKDAKIILDSHSSLFSCTVLDLTNLGACVRLPPSVGFPDSFALSFDSGRSSRQCQVVWRNKDKVGISFG
jgi:hypothetical protein